MSGEEYSTNSPYEGGVPALGFDYDEMPLNLDELDFEQLEAIGQLGGFGSWLKKAAKNVGKAAKKGLKVGLPIAKIAGTALAFVVPPAGIGIVAAAEGADRLLAAAEAGGKIAKTAAKTYKATKALAGKGDADARRALAVLKTAAATRKALSVPKGVPNPNLSGSQLQRDRGKLMRTIVRAPARKPVMATSGGPKPMTVPARTAPVAKPTTAPEKGFFVNMHGRVKPGAFKTA